MIAIYTVTLDDLKDVAFQMVKKLPKFRKKRLVFSLTYPFITLLFLFFPFFKLSMALILIPLLFLYYYFYGYSSILFTSFKKQRYRIDAENVTTHATIEDDRLVVNHLSITQKLKRQAIVDIIETSDKYILFLEKELSFIVIKKRPDNLSGEETVSFNNEIRSFLFDSK